MFSSSIIYAKKVICIDKAIFELDKSSFLILLFIFMQKIWAKAQKLSKVLKFEKEAPRSDFDNASARISAL